MATEQQNAKRNGRGPGREGSATDQSTDPVVEETISREEHLSVVEQKDAEISKLRDQLAKSQRESSSLAEQLVEANLTELRGRRLADAAYDVLIQAATGNTELLQEIQRATQEVQHSEG